MHNSCFYIAFSGKSLTRKVFGSLSVRSYHTGICLSRGGPSIYPRRPHLPCVCTSHKLVQHADLFGSVRVACAWVFSKWFANNRCGEQSRVSAFFWLMLCEVQVFPQCSLRCNMNLITLCASHVRISTINTDEVKWDSFSSISALQTILMLFLRLYYASYLIAACLLPEMLSSRRLTQGPERGRALTQFILSKVISDGA